MPTLALLLSSLVLNVPAQDDAPPLAEYFRAEVEKIAAEPLEGIDSAEVWNRRRPQLQRQMLEMLGLWPLPAKTDLKAEVTGTLERPEFVIEKVVFQSVPGLYVTGNLYRPKTVERPLPAILYVCGHAQVEKDGVIFGNKAHYQHHAAWYAANGYVCLVVDTLQLGEVPGLHHGTYREGMWWWLSRGYTPAGIEAWNGVRAIDYLVSRPEVDSKRLGVTGRSGGGATSWWLGAIDDRLSVVVPVAGITDLRDHVVGGDFAGPHRTGVVEGHCDCMFMANTYRWDYTMVAALVAPKALLLENTDEDPIFPEGGVRRVYEQLQNVYRWYGAEDELNLVIGQGGHVDSEEIRYPSFAFMEKWLKGKDVSLAQIEEPDRKVPIEELKVLEPGQTPEGSRNATIQESFIPRAEVPEVPDSESDWARLRERWMAALKEKVFAGWPSDVEEPPLEIERGPEVTKSGIRMRAFEFTSQEGVELPLWIFEDAAKPEPESTLVVVLNPDDWSKAEGLIDAFEDGGDPSADPMIEALRHHAGNGERLVLLTPRGIGRTAWDDRKEIQIRRRFYLLGQTLDGMRAWDVRRGLAALREIEDDDGPLKLYGSETTAPLALFAGLFEPEVAEIILKQPPEDVDAGPAFLNLDRILDMPQAVALLAPRAVRIKTDHPSAWSWASNFDQKADPSSSWLTIEELGQTP